MLNANYFLFQVISNIWRGREGWSTKQEVSNVVCAETLHVGLDFAAVCTRVIRRARFQKLPTWRFRCGAIVPNLEYVI